jgi:methionyl-tRNA formyltransferase
MGVAAMLESIDLVRDGKAPRVVQDPNEGSYEGWCRKEDVEIDWTRDTGTVYNLIRGANPQPGAWSTFNGAEVKILDSSKADGSGDPGSVIAVDDDTIAIATSDGAIAVAKVRTDGGKMSAGEFVSSSGMRVGDKFGG